MMLVRWLAAPLMAIAVMGPQDPLSGNDDRDELQATLRAMREMRAAHEAHRRELEDAIAAATQSARRLAAEVAELGRRDQDLDRQIAELKGERAGLQATGERDRTALADLGRSVDGAIAAAAQRVRSGLDHRREERLARLDPGTSDAGPQERLARLWTFVQEELRLARTSDLTAREIPLDRERTKHAQVFRVGHLLQGFVTEDGLECGLETRSGWQLVSSAPLERSVRHAVEMLSRRRPPALLAMPLSPAEGR